MKDNIFLDTSALMHSISSIEKLFTDNNLIICSVVLEELDKHKDGKDDSKAFKARQAIKFIERNKHDLEFLVNYSFPSTKFSGFDLDRNDNKILKYACDYHENISPLKILTNDICMKIKAEFLGLEYIVTEFNEDQIYKGYIEIQGTTEENDYKLLELSQCLHPNQYVIVHDTDTGETEAVKWKDGDYVDVIKSKKISPKNAPQSCAIDLMYDKDIPIKIICGGYGSGN